MEVKNSTPANHPRYRGDLCLLFLLFILSACTNSGFQSNNSTDAKKKNDENGTDASTKEEKSALEAKIRQEGTVEEPTMVGGAFLVCYKDETLPISNASRVGIGCQIGKDQVKETISAELLHSPLNFIHPNHQPEPAAVTIAETSSRWHWITELPNDQLDDLNPVLIELQDMSSLDKSMIYQGAMITDLTKPILAPKQFDQFLMAAKSYDPSQVINGTAEWIDASGAKETKNVVPPLFLPVVIGNAANHKSTLTFKLTGSKDVVCEYKGGSKDGHPTTAEEIELGKYYALDKCTGDKSIPSSISADAVLGEIQSGDDKDPANKTVIYVPLFFQ